MWRGWLSRPQSRVQGGGSFAKGLRKGPSVAAQPQLSSEGMSALRPFLLQSVFSYCLLIKTIYFFPGGKDTQIFMSLLKTPFHGGEVALSSVSRLDSRPPPHRAASQLAGPSFPATRHGQRGKNGVKQLSSPSWAQTQGGRQEGCRSPGPRLLVGLSVALPHWDWTWGPMAWAALCNTVGGAWDQARDPEGWLWVQRRRRTDQSTAGTAEKEMLVSVAL